MKNIVKGILLDYGGTIDTNGVHWAEVLWKEYVKNKVPVNRDAFWEAYRFGEYSLATSPLVKPYHNFLDVLLLKVERQFLHLQENKHLGEGDYSMLIQLVATGCNKIAKETIGETSQILEWLYPKYPLVMVSNFYGNLETVLSEYGIRHYFTAVIESSVAGVRKPSSGIYTLGV
jgi:putative hydrolase of the HAD superfamily